MAKEKQSWSEDEINKVWAKGVIVPNNNPNVFRKDVIGAWIRRADYGNTSSELNYGWEIDHKLPESLGGTDRLDNLQPLHWANNRAKGDNYPDWTPAVTSDGDRNIKK